MATLDNHLTRIETDLRVLKWMLGATMVLSVLGFVLVIVRI
jgi:hypothetical protein